MSLKAPWLSVPVKVKTKQGNTIITTYAFLDPGSTATFCTESILPQLQVTGRNTEILLRTMNKEESVKTSVACEICGLESNQYVALPPVYSQNKIFFGSLVIILIVCY